MSTGAEESVESGEQIENQTENPVDSAVENQEEQTSDATSAESANSDSPETEPPPSDVEVSIPEFAQLVDSGAKNSNSSIGRFRDIRVKVTAEIGNVSMPIGEILELAEGSVIELDKPTSAPIDLMAQGVRIAQGEVVVVDDCFAIRIKEIETPEEG